MSSFIKLRNITKIYPPNNVALNNVTVDIHEGEIHSIIGENGAGKSTLMKVLFGLEHPNEGEIFINGEKVSINSPTDAVEKGIGMVHQEFMLVQDFSIIENILLGVEPTKNGLIDFGESRNKVESILKSVNQNISVDALVKDISIAAQQKIEIVKQLYRDVDVLILDEPTAVLTPQESDELFELLFTLKKSGKTILFISHKLHEVLTISDRITIMRKGEHIWTKDNIDLTREDLANAMVGRDVLFTLNKNEIEPGEVVLEVSNLTSKNISKSSLKDISFTVRSGEIVGIAGVEGNGQFELVKAITEETDSTGSIKVNNVEILDKTIHDKREHFAFVPQDRKTQGSSQTDSLADNVFMTHHYLNPKFTSSLGFINSNLVNEFASYVLETYQVNTNNIRVPIGSLSGGNQQKILLGREFELHKDLLIVDQPVRGLDVGSIEYVHNSILSKRDEMKACLLISADLDELFNLSDIILVMYEGSIIAKKKTDETSKEEIGRYMLGVHQS